MIDRTLLVFDHRRSLKNAKTVELIANLFFISLFLSFGIYLVYAQDKPFGILFGKAIFLITAINLPFLALNLLRLQHGSGEWIITITREEVVWETPLNIGEKNFIIKIDGISKIICETTKKGDSSDWYYIEAKSGEKYHLNPSASGVNLNNFCNELRKLGVPYEIRYKP